MVKKRKKKRRCFKFFIVLLIITTLILLFTFIYKERFLDKVDYSQKGNITYYDIYGIHMNFEGNFKLSGYSNPKLVLTDGIKEMIINWDLDKHDDEYSFKTSEYINDGINLERLNTGTYYLLIKVSNDEEDIYFPLVNKTEYKDLEYYTLTGTDKKIDIIWDKYLENEILKFDIKNTKLPDDVYDITIDPGHDGSDAGMIVCANGNVPNYLGECSNSKAYKESDLNFTVSKALKDELEKLGYKVKLTRDSKDSKLPTYGKMGSGTTANTVKAKFNLALHHNSSNVPGGMSNTYGLEVYVAGNSKFDLAKSFVKNITEKANISTSTKEEFKTEDGIYQRFSDDGITPYYYMIREVGGIATHAYVDGSNTKYDANPYYNSNNTAEGYLLELGYIDNVKELKNIIDNPNDYARGIALGLDEYLKNTSD